MVFETEIIHEKQKAIVISKKNYSFLDGLKARLQKASVEYFFSSRAPNNLKIFDYCFLINERLNADIIKKYPEKKIIFILLSQKGKVPHDFKYRNAKVVSVQGTHLEESDIDKILWFAFSKTSEDFLKLAPKSLAKPGFEATRKFDWKRFTTRKFIFLTIIFDVRE